jgi:hypothetical protein
MAQIVTEIEGKVGEVIKWPKRGKIIQKPG